MDCTKDEFLAAITPWCGRRCLLISVSKFGASQVWLWLESVDEELVLTFSGSNPGDYLELHLSRANHFEFGDARISHESVRHSVEAKFDQLLLARAGEELVVTIMLPREDSNGYEDAVSSKR